MIVFSEVALFVPGYMEVGDDELKRIREWNQSLCSIAQEFFFNENYCKAIKTTTLKSFPVKISYSINGEKREFEINPEIYLSVFIPERKESLIRNNEGKILIPATLIAVVTLNEATVDDLIAIPFHVIWENGCKGKKNVFLDKFERMKPQTFKIAGGRFFIVDLTVNESPWKILKERSREFYGLGVTDEGYRAVREEYARKRLEEWIWGNRIYSARILSPVSIVQIRKSVNRLDVEGYKLEGCNLWERYILEHKNERPICYHGLLYLGQYLALTIGTIEVFRLILKGIPNSIPNSKERSVNDIREILKRIEEIKLDLESYLSVLDPRKVSKIPESTVVVERVYESRGLKSFSEEMKNALRSIEEVMLKGRELIEKRIEEEKVQRLELGVTLLEALPLGYLLKSLFTLFGYSMSVEVGITVSVPLLLILWWGYRSFRVKGWEREQTENFVKRVKKMLESSL